MQLIILMLYGHSSKIEDNVIKGPKFAIQKHKIIQNMNTTLNVIYNYHNDQYNDLRLQF